MKEELASCFISHIHSLAFLNERCGTKLWQQLGTHWFVRMAWPTETNFQAKDYLSFQQGQISCQWYISQILRSSLMIIFNCCMKENEWKIKWWLQTVLWIEWVFLLPPFLLIPNSLYSTSAASLLLSYISLRSWIFITNERFVEAKQVPHEVYLISLLEIYISCQTEVQLNCYHTFPKPATNIV
jgi:hypothetical protein